MEDKVTIIIPVYKVEKFLDRCLESVVNQTYTNLEVILIDDGSPDNSGKMCDQWAEKDNRIKVVHKQNAGLGMARNSGLDACTGDYITFLDSDDYLELNTIELTYNRITQANADICFFGQIYTYKSGNSLYYKYKYLPDMYEGDDIEKSFVAQTIAPDINQGGAPRIGMSSCQVLYKASIIQDNNIRFCSEREIASEDLIFRIEICQHIKKVAVLKEALYHYCYNGNSLTKSYNPNRFKTIMKMWERINDISQASKNKEILMQRNDRLLISDIIFVSKQEFANNELSSKEKKSHIKGIIDNKNVQNALRNYPTNNLPFQTKCIFTAFKMKNMFAITLLCKMKNKMDDKQ